MTIQIKQYRDAQERIFLYPDGSTCTDLTGVSSGTTYLNIDEERGEISTADYNYWQTNGTYGVDLYSLENNSTGTGHIDYVKVRTHAKIDYSPDSNCEYYLIVDYNSTCTAEWVSAPLTVTTDWSNLNYSWEENPERAANLPFGTSPDWIWSDIDTLSVGVKIDSGGIQTGNTIDEVIYPDGYGFKNEFIAEGESHTWAAVSDTDDSTYAHSTSSSYMYAFFNLDNPSLSGTINSVTVFHKSKKTESADTDYYIGIYIGSTEYYSDEKELEVTDTLVSHTWSENPNTSSAWTWTDINNLQAGIKAKNTTSSTNEIQCSEIYIIVNYNQTTVPKVKVASCYVEVGFTPNQWETVTINTPQEVLTSHTSVIRMINFWNGDREVYSLGRSNKKIALKGVQYEEDSCLAPDVVIAAIQTLGRRSLPIVIEDFALSAWNGTYYIRSFMWKKISEKPLNYEWAIELEDSEV